MRFTNNQKFKDKFAATSLVEIIFYFALLTIFLFAAMVFAIQILNANLISGNIQELQSNVDFISQQMTYAIQTANSVDEEDSLFDISPGTLSLNSDDTIIQFYLSDGVIYFKKGALAAVPLNSGEITADSLIFQRITYPKTPDQIMIDAEFSMTNADISNLRKTYSFHATASLRK